MEGVNTIPPLPPLPPSILPSLALQLNQLGGKIHQRGPGGTPAENEFGALYRAVRKPLLAIILSVLKCMFYSRSITEPANGGRG